MKSLIPQFQSEIADFVFWFIRSASYERHSIRGYLAAASVPEAIRMEINWDFHEIRRSPRSGGDRPDG